MEKKRYPYGVKKRVSERTGYTCKKINDVLSGVISKHSARTVNEIIECAKKEVILYNEEKSKRVDRYDIYNNLQYGDMSLLAVQFNTNPTHITYILKGTRPDKIGVIPAAELLAAKNIWVTRFCKFKSELV